ncbi:MAG: OPT family oligopeptide transporter, partial [Tissierellales bacterium]|nr:OPT family oligopeptide transporter [Tissierellales bacterium]
MEEKKVVRKHPSALSPPILILNILVAVLGAIIGLELITRLGISTNTSIVGALLAIII